MSYKPSFVEWRQDMNDPRRGDDGIAWAKAVGGAQDAELELLRVAALSRLPAYCPDDGLDLLGQAYALPRFASETNASYRGRLMVALQTYQLGGSAAAVVASLQAAGFGDVLVVPVWQTPLAPESSATSYSGFYVFLGPNFGTTGTIPLTLGSGWNLGISGSGLTLGSALTSDQLTAIKRQILRWKAAHGYPIKLFLVFGAQTVSNAPGLCQYPIGRTLGDGMPGLGSAGCILGGYL